MRDSSLFRPHFGRVFGAALALVAFATAAAAMDPARRLTVTGSGSAASVPDMATITVGVIKEADTAAEVLDATNDATRSVLAELADLGIAPEDMQINSLTLTPLTYNRNSSSAGEVSEYRATNTIHIKVRDLKALGAILDGVVVSGVNQFHGLAFGVQEPGPLQDEARIAAVKDAMRKAALYAEAAGLTLGPILTLNEGHGSNTPGPAFEMAARSSPVPFAAGEVAIRAQVTLVYELATN